MKRIIKATLCVFIAVMCFAMPKTVGASLSLSDGLYIYVGGDYAVDDNASNFVTTMDIGLGSPTNVTLVKSISNELSLVTAEDLMFNPSNISVGPAGGNVSFNAIVNSLGTHDLTLKDPEYTVQFNCVLKGLYLYTGDDLANEDDLSKFQSMIVLSPSSNADFNIVYIEGDTRTALGSSSLTAWSQSGEGITITGDAGSVNIAIGENQNYAVMYNGYSLSISTNNNPGSDQNPLAETVINQNHYFFGLNQYTGQAQDTVFLNDVIDFVRREESFDFDMVLMAGVGIKQTEAAPSEILDMISNLSINLTNNSITGLSYEIGQDKITAFGRNVYYISFSFPENAVGNCTVEASFDLLVDQSDTRHLTTTYTFRIPENNAYHLPLTGADMDAATFNDIFSSKENLFNKAGLDINSDVNNIVVVLPEGEFNGNYKINVDEFFKGNDNYATSGSKWFTIQGSMQEGSPDLQTKIIGTMQVYGGVVSFQDIMFDGNGATGIYIENLSIADKTVGIVAMKENGVSVANADAIEVFNCEFENYDYAIVSTNTGLVGGVCNSYFNNNGYCYYMDCKGTNFYSDGPTSTGNMFRNSTRSAIAFISTPGNKMSYSWRFMFNDFYNEFKEATASASDYYVKQDGTASKTAYYYCMFSYYGNTANISNPSQNLRAPKIDYGNTSYAKVITSPYVKFYGSAVHHDEMLPGSQYGIEDGDSAAIFKNSEVYINGEDINNSFSIEIASSDGKDILGGLINETEN